MIVFCSLDGGGCSERGVTRPGDEFFAILDEVVTQVSLRSERVTVIASKVPGTTRFSYAYQVRGGAPVSCPATAARNRALRQTFAIRAHDVIPSRDRKRTRELPASQRVELEVRSSIKNDEPFRLLLLQRAEPKQAWIEAYFTDTDTGAGVLVTSELLSLLDQAC